MCNGAVVKGQDTGSGVNKMETTADTVLGSNQVLVAQPQTVFSTPKILTRTHK